MFEDLDGDGVQGPNEPGIERVDVVITDADGNMITVTTDADGNWVAEDLSVGDTEVDVDETTLPADLSDTLTTTGSDPETVTVLEGVETMTTDDGYVPAACPSTVDTDGDGLTDCEETTGIDDPSTPLDPGDFGVDPNNPSDPNDPCDPIGIDTTDSDGDGCSDANEAYDNPDADGDDGGSFGTGEPQTSVNGDGLVTVAGVDYSIGTNAAVTDATDDSACDVFGDLSGTVFEDLDGDGVQDTGQRYVV